MENFNQLLRNYIKRDGIESLIAWLDKVDFCKAPASTKYHGAYEGGLVEHSINVFNCLRKEFEDPKFAGLYSDESIAIVSLLHDVCKFDSYSFTFDGIIFNKNHLPLGHGEKSVFLIQQHMKLTYDEMIAIRWHMGGWDAAAKGGDQDYGQAQSVALAYLLHVADMKASRFVEGQHMTYSD